MRRRKLANRQKKTDRQSDKLIDTAQKEGLRDKEGVRDKEGPRDKEGVRNKGLSESGNE